MYHILSYYEINNNN